MTLDLNSLKGFKARAVSVERLPKLKQDILKLINGKQLAAPIEEICLKFGFEVFSVLPGARSLIVVAVPQPLTWVTFTWQGGPHKIAIPPTYIGKIDDTHVLTALEKFLSREGFKLERVRLPSKTLAVRSGLAQYGRNNVTYVNGGGSYNRLLSFVTDAPLQDTWGERKMMPACAKCSRCADACPTHCISPDRFLIYAENCLTWQNENVTAFPDWVKPEWHNAIVGCMRCQMVCPVNKNYLTFIDGPSFSEDETSLILQKTPMAELNETTRQKLVSIELDDFSGMLARNLAAVLNNPVEFNLTPSF